MIVPVGRAHEQSLKLITKKNNILIENTLLPVRFVPMVQ
jgi:protein-L-isoaspartate O-methyltransferase